MFDNLAFLFFLLAIVFASLVSLFLFFRAARRELFEKELIFDFVFISVVAALIFGRLTDFLVRVSFYDWSAKKLFFFNIYPGFDLWGGLIGGFVFGFWFLRRKIHAKVWQVLDLVCPALALGISLVSLGLWATERKIVYFAFFAGYFVIFWIMKRLDKVRRHNGFFVCFFLIFILLLNLSLAGFSQKEKLLLEKFSYNFIMPSILIVIVSPFWYVISKRRLKEDIKGLFSILLLGIFKLKRILISTTEANNIARSIIFIPYYLVKALYFLVLLTGREVYLSFFDLLKALGLKRR